MCEQKIALFLLQYIKIISAMSRSAVLFALPVVVVIALSGGPPNVF